MKNEPQLEFNDECWNEKLAGKNMGENKNNGFWEDLDTRCKNDFKCSRQDYEMRSIGQNTLHDKNSWTEDLLIDLVYKTRSFGCIGRHCCTKDNYVPPLNSLKENQNCWIKSAVGIFFINKSFRKQKVTLRGSDVCKFEK